MPAYNRVDEWYDQDRRQPYDYPNGHQRPTKDPYDRRAGRASKSLDQRRRSLQHDHHFEYEHEHEHADSWETVSEDEAARARRGHVKRNSKGKKCACPDCRTTQGRTHHVRSSGGFQSDDFEHSENDWSDVDYHGKEHGHPGDQYYSDEDEDEDEGPGRHQGSKPQRPDEHYFANKQYPRGHFLRRRSQSRGLHSGDENGHRSHEMVRTGRRQSEGRENKGSARPVRPGEHKVYHPPMSHTNEWHHPEDETSEEEETHAHPRRPRRHPVSSQKLAMQRKSSRPSFHVPGAFSDDDQTTLKASLGRRLSDRSRKGRTLKSKHIESLREGEFSHVKAPSPPGLASRSSSRRMEAEPPEGSFRAPKPGRVGKGQRSQSYQHQSLLGGDITITTPRDSPSYLDANDTLGELKSHHYSRPGAPRSASDNVMMRSNIVFPGDHFEPGKLRVDSKPWKHAASMTSSNDMSHMSDATSSAPAGKALHHPLEHDMDFRLIRVMPERTAKLKCKILHASLENPPEYIAISYAWGDGVDQRKLVLDGATVSVSASLHGALRAVRDKTDEMLVWIDGLSIDQHNTAERAAQVQLMAQIYSRAHFVAIWLGPHIEDSQLAIPLLEDVAKGKASKKRIRAVSNPDSAALRSLLMRDYWNRLWAVQEVFLAREKWVFCGSSQLPWQAYKVASDALWEQEPDIQLRQGPSSFPNINSLTGKGAHSLLEVLRATRKKLTENPRDKIFGILGVLPEETRRDIPVDYNQPVKGLYIDVVNHIISSTRRLDVIREAIHFPLHSSSAGLPSWCPEWSHIPDISALREPSFAASGSTDAEIEFHDSDRRIEFAAIELGTIDAMGVAVGTLCALQDYLMAFLHWRALLLDMTAISEEVDENPLLEAFCRTLSLGQVPKEWERHGWMGATYHVFAALIQKRLPRLPVDRTLVKYAKSQVMQPSELRPFVQKHFGDRMMGRTFCITDNGLMGMGSGFMGKGDTVVVPFGCSTPILLRAEGRRGEYRYVGDVYVHGFMHGEALVGNKPVKKYMVH